MVLSWVRTRTRRVDEPLPLERCWHAHWLIFPSTPKQMIRTPASHASVYRGVSRGSRNQKCKNNGSSLTKMWFPELTSFLKNQKYNNCILQGMFFLAHISDCCLHSWDMLRNHKSQVRILLPPKSSTRSQQLNRYWSKTETSDSLVCLKARHTICLTQFPLSTLLFKGIYNTIFC